MALVRFVYGSASPRPRRQSLPSIQSSRDQAADSLDRPYSPAARPTETSQKRRRSPQITVGVLLGRLARISGLCDLAPRSRGSSSLEEPHLPDAGVTDGELGECHRRERENQGARRAEPLVKLLAFEFAESQASFSARLRLWIVFALPVALTGLPAFFDRWRWQDRLRILFATSSGLNSPGTISTPEPAFSFVAGTRSQDSLDRPRSMRRGRRGRAGSAAAIPPSRRCHSWETRRFSSFSYR